MEHFCLVCRVCRKLVAQCRCPDRNKAVMETVCSDCRPAEAERENLMKQLQQPETKGVCRGL